MRVRMRLNIRTGFWPTHPKSPIMALFRRSTSPGRVVRAVRTGTMFTGAIVAGDLTRMTVQTIRFIRLFLGERVMRTILLVLSILIAIGGDVHAGEAKDSVTVDPAPAGYAWWLRARFHPFETEVRGIPVQKIRKDWCKASEFRQELFPPELQADLKSTEFAVDGFFVGSKVKQTALVGVYETCAGITGKILLVLGWPSRGLPTVMFLRGGPIDHRHRR
jgi:hypothetical protein